MWLIIVLVIVIALFMISKKTSTIIYGLVAIDVLCRVCSYLSAELLQGEISNLLNNLPTNLISVFTEYTSGMLTDILMWIYVALYIMFEVYIIKLIVKKK